MKMDTQVFGDLTGIHILVGVIDAAMVLIRNLNVREKKEESKPLRRNTIGNSNKRKRPKLIKP